ncbi:MAG: c-type cytochrome [Bacteroidetes bacterium]|nr:c-type cytochrome [Bacteroidota bacterium]
MKLFYFNAFSIFLIFIVLISCNDSPEKTSLEKLPPDFDFSTIKDDDMGASIRYGKELIENTAYFIGPKGVAGNYLGNKMNCQNCHLDAGTKPFGLNFYKSHKIYPQYRGREGQILTLAQRINNCIERPHSGIPLPLDSKEMIAMLCYIKWIGEQVNEAHLTGSLQDIKYINRPADPEKGALIYERECKSCHGANGEGLMKTDDISFEYPPLWGPESYQPGSSMHRVIKSAMFIKANMPDGVDYKNPQLSDAEALDVAAFINNDSLHQRPKRTGSAHYPKIEVKPIDYDIGPYIDSFPAHQHKYGPFLPIIDAHKRNGWPVVF